jgi:hypothetical protein
MPLFLVLGLLICGLAIPAAVSAEDMGGHWVSSSTSVSGSAVVNETATLRMITYNGTLTEKKEWTFSNTYSTSDTKTWGSNLFLGKRENRVLFQFSRPGRFSPISINI